MPLIYLQLLLIAIVTAMACTLLGNFLVLRGTALMSDALSHAILFGIVIMFLIVQDINSPLIQEDPTYRKLDWGTVGVLLASSLIAGFAVVGIWDAVAAVWDFFAR